jgi:hypothetical protein
MEEFGVFENERPCSVEGYPGCKTWKNHKFHTFAEAVAYLKYWLGPVYSPCLPDDYNGSPLDYDGCEDIVEIKKL